MSDFDDYYLSNNEVKRNRVRLKHVAPGAADWTPPPKRGRPSKDHTDYVSFAAYYALTCDREIMALPRDENGDATEAAARVNIGISGRRMRDLALKFKKNRQPADGFQVATHWERYARACGRPVTEETFKRMHDEWSKAHRKALLQSLPPVVADRLRRAHTTKQNESPSK